MSIFDMSTKAIVFTTINLRDLCVIYAFCYKITKCTVYNKCKPHLSNNNNWK